MKINNVNGQQNFKGASKLPIAIAGLAGSSVIAQKIVMSGAEAAITPVMDIGVGKAITKVTKETDGRTNQSSKTQAIRTFSQAIGGTIVGVAVRFLCITGATLACAKLGEKAGSLLNPKNISKAQDLYKFQENAAKWGKSIGGAVAIGVMMFTNFLIDVPLINLINEKVTAFSNKNLNKDSNQNSQEQKEVK